MKYLDYLLTHAYADLPAGARAEITEQDYARRRAFARAMSRQETELPTQLQRAYRQALHPRPRKTAYWLAAAGWLLAITVFLLVLNRDPHVEYVTQLSPPVIQRDTVEVIRRDTLERVVYRDRVRRDTVFTPAPPPAYVVLRDTVYRTRPEVYPRGTASVDPGALSLLVGTAAD